MATLIGTSMGIITGDSTMGVTGRCGPNTLQYMATIVQSACGAYGNPTATATLPSNPTPGNLLLVFQNAVLTGGNPAMAGSGWTYGSAQVIGSGGEVRYAYKTVASGQSNVISTVYQASSQAYRVVAYECTGRFDASAGFSNGPASGSAGLTVTPATAGRSGMWIGAWGVSYQDYGVGVVSGVSPLVVDCDLPGEGGAQTQILMLTGHYAIATTGGPVTQSANVGPGACNGSDATGVVIVAVA